MRVLKTFISLLLLSQTLPTYGQVASASAIDGTTYGVVLDHPAMAEVNVKSDILYFKDDSTALHLDVYTPPNLSTGDKRPAIIFLNTVGDHPGERKIKSWGIYSTWPKLMAAHGYVGISMETDRSNVIKSVERLFYFLAKNGIAYNIDPMKLGVYAASANVTGAVQYLMDSNASTSIKAAVLYYGRAPTGPFRKDLPVYFVISESDVARNGYAALWTEVLKNNAPWTIKMATGMPHAFDAFKDSDESRIIVKETISFWKNHLDPVAKPSWSPSKGREILAYLYSEPAKALDMLKALTEENPTDSRALFTYGEILFREKRYEEARSAFTRITEKDPQYINALIQMAAMSYTTNKPDDAEKYINKAVSTGKMTANSYAQLGFSLLVANKNNEAARFYEKAISITPRGVDYYNLACAYAKEDQKGKALDALEKAVDLGYGSRQHVETDGDLNSIRNEERYKNIVSRIQ